jgi:hypothetical protein
MQVTGLRTPVVSAPIQHAPSEMNNGFRPLPSGSRRRYV